MARRKSIKGKDNYFGDNEQDAVVAYNKATTVEEKHKIYNDILKEPFEKMAEIVYKRYRSRDNKGGYEIEDIISNALAHLIENMHKYDPNRLNKKGLKSKAYSYYQTVIHNYYKDHGRNSYKEMISNLAFEDYFDEVESKEENRYEIDAIDEAELKEKLINIIIEKFRIRIDAEKSSLKKNEIIVGQAIISVLENWHKLFMEDSDVGNYNKKVSNNFAKNKILFYLKEITNLSTKEIRSSMKQYKDLYFFEKNAFFKDEC